MHELRALESPVVKEVRGRGLMIGVEIDAQFGPARPFCEGLQARGILAKETHESVVRFAPPLVVEKSDLEWAIEQIGEVLVPEMAGAR
jgi:ornithine--oxo-acid transaminase